MRWVHWVGSELVANGEVIRPMDPSATGPAPVVDVAHRRDGYRGRRFRLPAFRV
jgi:hypothetical protein